MSERNQPASMSGGMPQRSTSKSMFLVLGGTAAVAFVAGFMLQFVRPAAGQAQEKSAAAPGKATVTGTKNEAARYLARITNGKQIVMVSYDEVAHECMLRHGNEVLDNIINRKIIETACENQNIQISEAEVDQEIVKIAKKFNMSVSEWYNMLQAERSVTKAQYRRDIIWPMLSLRKLAGEDIKISKNELQQAFLKNYGPRVKARIIVSENQRRAAEAWEMATQDPQNIPANFQAAVNKYSQDAGSRALGGAIPPIPQFSGNPLSEPLEKAAFKLQPGQVSSVIQSGQQFVIILSEGRTEQVVQSIEEVQDELIAALKEEKTQHAVAETFDRIREVARIDNFLKNETTGGPKKPVATGTGTGQPAPRQPGAQQAAPGAAKPAAKAAVTSRPGAAAQR